MPQSPVDIVGAKAPAQPAPPLEINYQSVPARSRLEHNQWTIQIDVAEGSYLQRGEERYDLIQFHFHEPSEHYIEGKRFALEAHFVHKKQGAEQLAVLGVMVEKGAANSLLEQITPTLPKNIGDGVELAEALDPTALLPTNLDYYDLMGSLTTEPYSEGVRWFILTTAISASPEQIERFHQVLHDNARPLQPLGNRDIFICCGR